MSKTATEQSQEKMWPGMKASIKLFARDLNLDAEALAIQSFDCELDSLLQWQAAKLCYELSQMYYTAKKAKRRPHRHVCIDCEHRFDCECASPDSAESICHPCREGVSRGQYYRMTNREWGGWPNA
jgi:hypothetical protein